MSTTKMALLIVAGTFLASCSVYMAAKQPEQKNLAVLTEGTHQPLVRAELGNPIWSGKDDQGFDVEVYQFVQGYSQGARTARTLWHGVADVFTLGLWEVVGTPIEAVASGTKMKATVTYDLQQKVKTVKLLDDQGNEIPLQEKREQ